MICNRHGIGRTIFTAIAVGCALTIAACTPDKALDFGPVGEISTPPKDPISRDLLRDYAGKQFDLGDNDREAHVSITGAPAGHRIVLPFWLGVNPLYPGFLRPTVGHIYVMSESTMVRTLAADEYLIRAGSKLFKSDTVFEAIHTRYAATGAMLPTMVRFVGTRVITVPKDPPATGTITEKVPVLREVSLPMHTVEDLHGYAKFDVINPEKSPAVTPHLSRLNALDDGKRVK